MLEHPTVGIVWCTLVHWVATSLWLNTWCPLRIHLCLDPQNCSPLLVTRRLQPIQVICRELSGRLIIQIVVKSLASCSRIIKPSRLCFEGFISCRTCQPHHVAGGSQLPMSLGTRLAIFTGAGGLSTAGWRETLAVRNHTVGGHYLKECIRALSSKVCRLSHKVTILNWT